MDLLLASAPHADTFGYSMPPPGLLRLGGELERRGFDVALEDLAFRQAQGNLPEDDALCAHAAALLCGRGPARMLGLSVMGATLPAALEIARHYRAARPGVPILLGGPGTTGVDERLLERFPFIDAVVRGEGEETLPELLQRWPNLTGVAGVTWRVAGAVRREDNRAQLADLGALAPYASHLLPPLSAYKAITGEADGLVPLDSGRGCVYDCSFCTIGRFWSRRSRPLPAARLADEIVAAGELEGGRNAYLCHDLFGADRVHALELCDALEARTSRVPWEVRARADHLDRELLERMGRAGCYRVLLGIESADPGVRRANQKGMRDDVDLLGVVDDCAAAGVTPILSLILGLPGEDEAALARTLDFCADAALRAGVNLSLHLANPQPGCGLGEEVAGQSSIVEGLAPDMAWGAGSSAPERALIDAHPDLFSTWHHLPLGDARLHDLRAIAHELPEVLMRYPRTFALLRRRRALNALELYRDWRANGRSFDAFARSATDALVDDTLAWEQALVRAGARGAPLSVGPAPHLAPRASAELVAARHDLSVLTAALLEADSAPAPPRAATHLAVVPVPRAMAGVRTLRISGDVARLLGELDGTTPLSELDARRPGLEHALTRLHAAGLVSFAAPRS